jgi:hypothetical protein
MIKLQLGLPLHKKVPISFGDFVGAVANQPVPAMDPHWRIQYYQTCHPGLKHSFIGKFESLEPDLRNICDKLGLDFVKYYEPERGHATDATNKIKQFYTEPIRDMVAKKYELDFRTFGYEA